MPEVVDDLPAGARRLVQRCRGVLATVVNGEVLLREGKPTGALPGDCCAVFWRGGPERGGMPAAPVAAAAMGPWSARCPRA